MLIQNLFERDIYRPINGGEATSWTTPRSAGTDEFVVTREIFAT